MGREGEESLWAASTLAETSGLAISTAAKVLKLLAKSHLILAQRGAAGGYKLAKDPAEISMAEIIEAMDGPIAITDCSKGSTHKNCKIHSFCPMSSGWNKVNKALREALSAVSLADMLGTQRLFENSAPRSKKEA